MHVNKRHMPAGSESYFDIKFMHKLPRNVPLAPAVDSVIHQQQKKTRMRVSKNGNSISPGISLSLSLSDDLF